MKTRMMALAIVLLLSTQAEALRPKFLSFGIDLGVVAPTKPSKTGLGIVPEAVVSINIWKIVINGRLGYMHYFSKNSLSRDGGLLAGGVDFFLFGAPTTMGVYLGADVGLAVNTYKDVTKSTKADFLFDIHAGFRWRFLDARVGTFVPTVRSSLIKDNFGIWISLGYRFHL